MAYNFQDALKARLSLISSMGESQTTWQRLQMQKQAVDQRLAQQRASIGNMSGGTPQGAVGAGGDAFERFKQAIAYQESGNNFNPKYPAGNPYNAMGKYSILSSALGGQKSGWDYQALGYDVTPQQFMAPDIQEKVATYHLKRLYDRYGAAGAAVAWYAGEGTAQKYVKNGGAGYSKGQAGGYPSINKYVQQILKRAGLA
jgi:hypothetical protein